jgi:hypothetical protein
VDTAAVAVGASAAPLQIVSSQMAPLREALCASYDQLGLDEATGGDEVFRQLVLARIIEPTRRALWGALSSSALGLAFARLTSTRHTLESGSVHIIRSVDEGLNRSREQWAP